LYSGLLIGYPVPIFDLPEDTSLPARSSSANGSRAKAAAYSYLSVVDGVAMRHRTWAECALRVKGRSGARFKKATSADNEAEILRTWNVRL
jgi:ribonuclease HI